MTDESRWRDRCRSAARGRPTGRARPPRSTLVSPGSFAASFYHALGIDCRKEYKTNTGRPIAIVRNGKPIPELFG